MNVFDLKIKRDEYRMDIRGFVNVHGATFDQCVRHMIMILLHKDMI